MSIDGATATGQLASLVGSRPASERHSRPLCSQFVCLVDRKRTRACRRSGCWHAAGRVKLGYIICQTSRITHTLTCAPGTTAFQVISAGRLVGRARGLADAQRPLIGLPRTAPRLRSCGCPAPPASNFELVSHAASRVGTARLALFAAA